jgi:hypothetical protein
MRIFLFRDKVRIIFLKRTIMVLATSLFAILLLSSPLYVAAKGSGSSNDGNNIQATQTGWSVSWTIVTGPAYVPSELGGPLHLQGMISKGTCQLKGMIPGTNAGVSGECSVLGVVMATGYGVSMCEDSFALGASPELPAAWMVMPPQDSELPLFYGITTVNGQAVQDFRVSSSNLLQPQGFNTGLCSSFLFEGYSADLFVPGMAGSFNFSGTPGAFGTFLFYQANVSPIYSYGQNGN